MTLSVGTYLPPWGTGHGRLPGYDEDALTMAVEAGRLAIGDGDAVTKVVFVSRDLPQLDGGNAAPLLAALRLGRDIEVVEQIGGAPAALDALASAEAGTLVIGVDAAAPAGAAAVLIGAVAAVTPLTRVQRSFPQRTRFQNGQAFDDPDPRMLREVGIRQSIEAAGLTDKPLVIAGLAAKMAAAWTAPDAPALPTLGASSPLFAVAALIEAKRSGVIAAAEQGAFAAATVTASSGQVRRAARPVQAPAKRKATPGTGVKISLAAYDRAFESKVRWQAAKCTQCGTLSMPPRHHCLGCGADGTWDLVPLPQAGTIYTTTTIHVPVPSLESPYSLAVVQCDDTDVRVLMHVTDVPPGATAIGVHGRVVLRRVALRTGVLDYGPAFSPDLPADGQIGGTA
jgi:uncharacterized OB-fold protein